MSSRPVLFPLQWGLSEMNAAIVCVAEGASLAPPIERKTHVFRHGQKRCRAEGFTLIEAMLSVVIFGMLMLAVASVWQVCWMAAARVRDGGRAGKDPELAMKRLSQAVEASVFRPDPHNLFSWQGLDGGRGTDESDRVGFVTALAPDASGARGGHSPLERILLSVKRGSRGGGKLMLSAGPYTMGDGDWAREVVLIGNVAAFRVQYWSGERKEWGDGWSDEGRAPGAVRFAIALEGEPAPSDFAGWKHTVTVALPESEAQGSRSRVQGTEEKVQSPKPKIQGVEESK